MDPVIAFRDVSYGIRGREILRHFDLDVFAGETLVLLGRSGAGKTTALKMVNALVFQSGGDVLVEGKSTREWDAIRRDAGRRLAWRFCTLRNLVASGN